jgi:methylglutaconyl-CoA hydratase
LPYTTILISDAAPIRTITLNRSARRNAMTPEMQTELIAAMQEASTSARVLILTGAGDAFCSGLDLSALQSMQDGSADSNAHRADAQRVATLFRTLYELPIPTIAAVHGPAIAGGTGLATICDFTLATPTAKFGYTEARIGFVPALVSAYLALQLGDKRSRDLLLTARIFDASEAHRLALVNRETADFREGVAAFLQKRKPTWTK